MRHGLAHSDDCHGGTIAPIGMSSLVLTQEVFTNMSPASRGVKVMVNEGARAIRCGTSAQ